MMGDGGDEGRMLGEWRDRGREETVRVNDIRRGRELRREERRGEEKRGGGKEGREKVHMYVCATPC